MSKSADRAKARGSWPYLAASLCHMIAYMWATNAESSTNTHGSRLA